MNNPRRKAIALTLTTLRAAAEKFKGELDDAKSAIETARDEEQEYRDNMPESMQDGEKGGAADDAINALEEFIGTADEFEDTCDTILTAIDDLEGAGL